MLLKGDFPTQEGDDLMNKLSRKDLLLVGFDVIFFYSLEQEI